MYLHRLQRQRFVVEIHHLPRLEGFDLGRFNGYSDGGAVGFVQQNQGKWRANGRGGHLQSGVMKYCVFCESAGILEHAFDDFAVGGKAHAELTAVVHIFGLVGIGTVPDILQGVAADTFV